MAIDEEGNTPMFASFTKLWHTKPYDLISPKRPELAVTGKNVVIAGGGTGIGKATAIAFAQANAASVSVIGRRVNRVEETAQEIRKAGPKTEVLYEKADMSQRSEADAALRNLASKFGKVDIFIWCAGPLPQRAQVKGYDEKEFRRGFEHIALATFNAVQAFMPIAARDAKLFNVPSGIAHISPMPELGSVFNYGMYKLAVTKMFDYLASENPGLHVVNIQPGVVDTEINEGTEIKGQDEGTTVSKSCSRLSVPLTSSKVELPTWFMVWLASKEAAFLNGRFVWVNWDVEELLARKEEIEQSMLLRIVLEGVSM